MNLKWFRTLKHEELIGLSCIILMLLAGISLYPHLPAQVPSHWNFQGEVDGYSSRFWGAFGIPILSLGIYLLMEFLPKIDPSKQNYQFFLRGYKMLRLALVLFFTLLYTVVITNALGYDIKVDIVVKFSIAVLFIIIGNYMSTFRHNYFCGIRTPWTLANKEVWQKTHRFGAKLFVLCGFIALLTSFCPPELGYLFFLSILAAPIIVIIYSYFLYKKVENQD